MTDRRRYSRLTRWLRLHILGVGLTRCICCHAAEVTAADLLCDGCYAQPDIKEAYLDGETHD